MSGTPTSPTTGAPQVRGNYDCDEGARQLVAQRINGRVALSDVPASDHGKVYLIERHLHCMDELEGAGGRLPRACRPTRTSAASERLDLRMSGHPDKRSSIEQRLMEEARRTAGRDGSGEPVRLGERDCGGHIVGYVDEQGLAWESLRERILAVSGTRLAEALALP